MRLIAIAGAIGLVGCVTQNVTRLGPFVRNIQAGPQQSLVVDSCVIQHTVEKNYAWWWIGENASVDQTLDNGQCWRQHIPTATGVR